MTGTTIFDCLAGERRSPDQTTDDAEALRELAEHMVAAAITSGQALRSLRHRMFPSEPSGINLAIAKALRVEFEKWVNEAGELYTRCAALDRGGHAIADLPELNDLMGRAQAMLQITLESHLSSLNDPGKPWSIEEVRRELHVQGH
jgi:hypothetical protein